MSWSCWTACLAPQSAPDKTGDSGKCPFIEKARIEKARTKKARTKAGLLDWSLWGLCAAIAHHLTSAGSLPPLAASLDITCLCSQMFMVAESLVSPV